MTRPLDLMAIRQFPVGEQQPNARAIGDAVRDRVVGLLNQRLSPSERKAWDSRMSLQDASPLSSVDEQILRKFDEVLIQEARALGWRLYCYPAAMKRIVWWCYGAKNGSTLLKRFNKAFETGVAVSRGEGKAPIDAHLKQARQELIPEVKRLRNLLRGRFQQRSLPGKDTILAVALELIATPSHRLIYLAANSTAIRAFDTNDIVAGEKEDSWLFELLTGMTSPAVFVNALIAWSTNRDEEALRQALTKQ